MNQASLKSRSLALTSVLVIILLIDLGWIYSRFPANWFQPLTFEAFFSLTVILLSGAIVSPSLFTILTLPIAISLTRRKIGNFKIGAKYALFLIPLLPAFLMLAWGAYCSVHPAPLFNSGTLRPPQEINPSSMFCNYWIDKPWYAKVVSDVFFSDMVCLFGLAYYAHQSKNWLGERWMVIWAAGNNALWITFLCGQAELAMTRPFFWQ